MDIPRHVGTSNLYVGFILVQGRPRRFWSNVKFFKAILGCRHLSNLLIHAMSSFNNFDNSRRTNIVQCTILVLHRFSAAPATIYGFFNFFIISAISANISSWSFNNFSTFSRLTSFIVLSHFRACGLASL